MACATGGWRETGLETETSEVQNQAPKMRAVPAVRYMFCELTILHSCILPFCEIAQQKDMQGILIPAAQECQHLGQFTQLLTFRRKLAVNQPGNSSIYNSLNP